MSICAVALKAGFKMFKKVFFCEQTQSFTTEFYHNRTVKEHSAFECTNNKWTQPDLFIIKQRDGAVYSMKFMLIELHHGDCPFLTETFILYLWLRLPFEISTLAVTFSCATLSICHCQGQLPNQGHSFSAHLFPCVCFLIGLLFFLYSQKVKCLYSLWKRSHLCLCICVLPLVKFL